jgi:hypothetical protein
MYIDYFRLVTQESVLGELNFDHASGAKNLLGNSSYKYGWLETYTPNGGAEASGVAKLTLPSGTTPTTIGIQPNMPFTVEQLKTKNWHTVEIKLTFDFLKEDGTASDRTSVDGVYDSSMKWTRTIEDGWYIYTTTKANILGSGLRYATEDFLWTAMTNGTYTNTDTLGTNERLFSIWSMSSHGNMYVD